MEVRHGQNNMQLAEMKFLRQTAGYTGLYSKQNVDRIKKKVDLNGRIEEYHQKCVDHLLRTPHTGTSEQFTDINSPARETLDEPKSYGQTILRCGKAKRFNSLWLLLMIIMM
jgi:hypothetical protein